MLLLMPFLLLTTSVQKLAGIDLLLAGNNSELPPEPPGIVEGLTVVVHPDTAFDISAQVRRSDVGAKTGETEARSERIPPGSGGVDLAALQNALRRYKGLDPERDQATLLPADSLNNGQVVNLMDAMRRDAEGELFPKVALGVLPAAKPSAEPAPTEPTQP
jgi:hypothetical protein